jgi:nucleoside-diphosphate-sugar epimerase
MKILITGGNGYVGKSLYNFFKDKYNVTSISRNDFNLNNFEETKLFFKDRYFDVVIHCAISGGSRLKEDTVDVVDNNLKMYYNLLNNKDSYKKFINFGSGAEFTNPNSFYGKSKIIISESIKDKPQFYNIIIYGVFDENELDTRFIKSNIKRYINKEPMIINSNKKMTFFYMNDLIKLVNHIIISDPGKLTHLNWASYGNNYSLFEIAQMINNLDNHKVDINIINKFDADYTTDFNSTYPLEYVGLENGIKKTYELLKKIY